MGANSPRLHGEQLQQLSDEVSRIAGTLARLSTDPSIEAPPRAAPLAETTEQRVKAVIRARRVRSRYFPDELFADPAWDMLLELFRAELAQQRTTISSLCIAAAVPATTALRWINTMIEKGLLSRRDDPRDGRRVFVELSAETHDAMARYFAEAGALPAV